MRLPRRFAPRNDTPHKIVRLPSVDRNDNLLYEIAQPVPNKATERTA